VLATMNQAAEAGRILDANYDVAPEAYRKGERRKDAYNFFSSPALIDSVRPGGSAGKDIGLRFGPAPPGAQAAGRASVRFSDISRVTVEFDPGTGRYTVLQDGDAMTGFAPANVVVQHVEVRGSGYVDVVGNVTPYTATVGQGAATVLRGGVLLPGAWTRPAPEAGTRLVDAAQVDLPLAPGPTLFLLVPAGAALEIG
jgi:hypothetical protein